MAHLRLLVVLCLCSAAFATPLSQFLTVDSTSIGNTSRVQLLRDINTQAGNSGTGVSVVSGSAALLSPSSSTVLVVLASTLVAVPASGPAVPLVTMNWAVPTHLTPFANRVYFIDEGSYQLWLTDGTPAGTTPLLPTLDGVSGLYASSPAAQTLYVLCHGGGLCALSAAAPTQARTLFERPIDLFAGRANQTVPPEKFFQWNPYAILPPSSFGLLPLNGGGAGERVLFVLGSPTANYLVASDGQTATVLTTDDDATLATLSPTAQLCAQSVALANMVFALQSNVLASQAIYVDEGGRVVCATDGGALSTQVSPTSGTARALGVLNTLAFDAGLLDQPVDARFTIAQPYAVMTVTSAVRLADDDVTGAFRIVLFVQLQSRQSATVGNDTQLVLFTRLDVWLLTVPLALSEAPFSLDNNPSNANLTLSQLFVFCDWSLNVTCTAFVLSPLLPVYPTTVHASSFFGLLGRYSAVSKSDDESLLFVCDGTAAGTHWFHLSADVDAPIVSSRMFSLAASEFLLPLDHHVLLLSALNGSLLRIDESAPAAASPLALTDTSAAGLSTMALVAVADPPTAGALPALWLTLKDTEQRIREVFSSDALSLASLSRKYSEPLATDSSAPSPMLAVGRTPAETTLYFSANDGIHGYELFRLDDCASGCSGPSIALVVDLAPGIRSSGPADLTLLPSDPTKFVFRAKTAVGSALFISDGTAAGTVNVSIGLPREFTPLGGSLLFVGDAADGDGVLWITQGTPATTRRVFAQGDPQQPYSCALLTAVAGQVVFVGVRGTENLQLWISDGASARPITSYGSQVVPMVVLGASERRQSVFFAATALNTITQRNASMLFVTTSPFQNAMLLDPTQADLEVADPFNVDFVALPPSFGADLFVFRACNDATGCELWQTDGTAANTRLYVDVLPGPTSSNPFAMAVSGDMLFFIARNAEWNSSSPLSFALYSSTGAGQVTQRMSSGVIADRLTPITQPANSLPRSLVLFDADQPETGHELWAASEDEIGLVADIWPGYFPSSPEVLAVPPQGATSQQVIISAQHPSYGVEPFLLYATPIQNAPATTVVQPVVTRLTVPLTVPLTNDTKATPPPPDSFELALVQLREVTPAGVVVAAVSATGTGGTRTTTQTINQVTDSFVDAVLSNGALFSTTWIQVVRGITLQFATQTVALADNAVKFTFNVTGWPFASAANRLEVLVGVAAEGDSAFCKQKATSLDVRFREDGFIDLQTKRGLVVRTRFLPLALVDGTPAPIQQRVATDAADAVANQDFVLILSLPSFTRDAVVDPDVSMSVLFETGKDGEPTGELASCKKGGGGLSRQKLIIIITSTTVGGAIMLSLCVCIALVVASRTGRCRRLFSYEDPEDAALRRERHQRSDTELQGPITTASAVRAASAGAGVTPGPIRGSALAKSRDSSSSSSHKARKASAAERRASAAAQAQAFAELEDNPIFMSRESQM